MFKINVNTHKGVKYIFEAFFKSNFYTAIGAFIGRCGK